MIYEVVAGGSYHIQPGRDDPALNLLNRMAKIMQDLKSFHELTRDEPELPLNGLTEAEENSDAPETH